MHLRIERDGQVLFNAHVDSIEYAEKGDGTVSVVGRPAQPDRPAGGFMDALKALGDKAAERKREETIEHGRMLRDAPVQQTEVLESGPGDQG